MSEAGPAAGEAEGDADDEPDPEDDEHGREGHGAAGSFAPKEEVQHEEGGEHDPRDQNWRQSDILLPLLATERLVYPGADVAPNEAKDGVEQDHDRA